MTTNREWLYSLDVADLADWFDAEHVEHQEQALDGDTSALNAKIAELERKLRISWEYECKFQDERDELQEQVDELKAERVKLRSQICKLEDDLVGTSDERDEWKSRWEIGKAQFDAIIAERELYREALSQLLDTVTDGMGKVSAILDNYDEGMA